MGQAITSVALLASLLLAPGVALAGAAERSGPMASRTADHRVESDALKARALQLADEVPLTVAVERDRILILLAYAVAIRDWQRSDDGRGHNVAAVLVDEDAAPVFWARNSVHITSNLTQHAELRAMTCYLARYPRSSLAGFSLYTTLEPCAMCSGMLLMTFLPRVVWGQRDPRFGGAIERLGLDSRSLEHGHAPYPVDVRSDGSTGYHRYWLDLLYEQHAKDDPDLPITDFLRTPAAKAVFADALHALLEYEATFAENQPILDDVLAFYAGVPTGYVHACPAH